MKNYWVVHSGKECLPCFFPKEVEEWVFDENCCLFFSNQLPFGVFTGRSNTIQVVIFWETEVFVMQ